MTTHCEYLLTALPSSSRIYIDRSAAGLRTIRGITTAQAISLMTGGHDKALHILVEDDVAETVLTEILRRSDPTFLRTVKIHQAGDTKTIHSVMRALNETGLPVAAVRDGDKEGSPAENIFKLPGSQPPEKELLPAQSVKDFLRAKYNLEPDDFLASTQHTDHHEWFKKLSEQVSISSAAIAQQVAEVYVRALPENEVDTLTIQLKESIRR